MQIKDLASALAFLLLAPPLAFLAWISLQSRCLICLNAPLGGGWIEASINLLILAAAVAFAVWGFLKRRA